MKKIALAACLLMGLGAQAQSTYKNSTLGFEIKPDKDWTIKVDTPNMRYHDAKAKAEKDLSRADILENIYYEKDSANKLTVMVGWIPPDFRQHTDSFRTLLMQGFIENLKKSGLQAMAGNDTVVMSGHTFYKTNVVMGIPNQIMIMADVYYWDNKERNLYMIAEYANQDDLKTITAKVEQIAATLKEKKKKKK